MPKSSRPGQHPAELEKARRGKRMPGEGETEASSGPTLSQTKRRYKNGSAQPGAPKSAGPSQRELYEAARKCGLPGRSRMTKAQLARALAR
jgi:hypothetical protein